MIRTAKLTSIGQVVENLPQKPNAVDMDVLATAHKTVIGYKE